MAKQCPECGTEALAHFTKCKECGFKFRPQENPPPYAPGQSNAFSTPQQASESKDEGQSAKPKGQVRSKSQMIKARMQLSGQIKQSRITIERFIHPKYISGDKVIPLQLLRQAKAIAIISQVKAGFIFSGILGTGIIVARLPSGGWSGPSSIGTAGMGWGAQIGASKTDSVIILNTDLGVKCFSGRGQVRLGADIQVAAGPVGRDATADVGVGTGGAAPAYSYSHAKGLYAGVSLQGLIISSRDDDNAQFYGEKASPKDILAGKLAPPYDEELNKFYELLKLSEVG